MGNIKETESFHYTYSAKEQEEINRIRQKYISKEEDKMDQLRKLDRSVMAKGTSLSLVVGLLGTMLLGIGMCCTMVWTETLFIPGIVLGLLGIVILGLAYPLYLRITARERQKIAPEIMRLTDELLK